MTDTKTGAFGGLTISFGDPAPAGSPGAEAVRVTGEPVTARVVVIGAGPAGLTAAIYAGRGGLAPVVLGGHEPGGQLMLASEVENFPGFPDGIMGPDLMARFRAQAERFGSRMVDTAVDRVDFSGRPFRLWADGPSTARTRSSPRRARRRSGWGSRARSGSAAGVSPRAPRATGSSSRSGTSPSSAAATPRSRRRSTSRASHGPSG